MNWLRRLLPGRNPAQSGAPIVLDIERRTDQLQELENALDTLVTAMSAGDRMANPGWKARVAEYKRQSGTAYTLRRGGFTREQLLDLAFEIRPVGDELPADLAAVAELQVRVMNAAEALREVLPSEQPAE